MGMKMHKQTPSHNPHPTYHPTPLPPLTGVVLYEYLGEEYPEVLGSILGALKAIVNVIGGCCGKCLF